MQLILPAPVTQALSRLEGQGHESYVVGGCVRDHVLGKTPKEYDLCSAATPDELRACFSEERIIETGLRHGTLTVIIGTMPLEITTFRSDGHYSDSRHPDSVIFSKSIMEDLKRRDFTCNAMAYSPERGFVDPYSGTAACHNRLLEAVGDPKQRFSEDALRILRALRFSAVLGFSIEEETARAAYLYSPMLKKISRERIAKELNLALTGDFAAAALRKYPQLLFAALPQLGSLRDSPQRSDLQADSLWELTLRVISRTPDDLSLRWAALLHAAGGSAAFTDGIQCSGANARIAESCMASLRQAKKLSRDVYLLVLHQADRFEADQLRRKLSELGLDLLRRLMRLQYAVMAAHSPDVAKQAHSPLDLIPLAESMIDEGVCLSLKDLKVNGDMLIQAGVPRGPTVGKMLNYLLEMNLSDKVANDRAALLDLARKRMAER